jgi:hypothetical protein
MVMEHNTSKLNERKDECERKSRNLGRRRGRFYGRTNKRRFKKTEARELEVLSNSRPTRPISSQE